MAFSLKDMDDRINETVSQTSDCGVEEYSAVNLSEVLSRMNTIINNIRIEKRIKVFFVTFLYEFAHGYHSQNMGNAIFLRAERQTDGTRTFKLSEGEPLETSYVQDLYHQIFNNT